MKISGMNSASASTLFSGLSGGGGLYSSLGDYGSIRSGSYGKLLNAYYKEMGSSSATSTSSSSASKYAHSADRTSRGYAEAYQKAKEQKASSTKPGSQSYLDKVATESQKASSSVVTYSNEAVKSLDTLRSADTFKKNSAGVYDTDKIYKAVTSYVDSYNGMIEGAQKSKSSGISSNVSSLQNTTKSYSFELASVGITIGENGKLSVNEETFKKSDMSDVKSLFDKGSYGYSARTSAYMTGYYAKQDVSNSTAYASNGSFSFSDMVNSFATSI